MISIFPITVLLPSLSFVYRESYTNDKIFHVSRIEVMARKLYFQISLIFTCTTHIPRTNSIPFSSEETCNHRARDDRKKGMKRMERKILASNQGPVKSSPIFRERRRRREKLLLFINGLNPVALANLRSSCRLVGNNSPPHGKNRSS